MELKYIVAIYLLIGSCFASNFTVPVGLAKKCPSVFVDVDKYQNVYVQSVPVDNSEFQMNRRHEQCDVSLMTGLVDHGICVSVLQVALSCDVDVLFKTNAYEADKKIDCKHARPTEWCTVESLMTLSLKARHTSRSSLDGLSFKFLMKVQAVPNDHIRKIYYMDSKLECGVQHKLHPGESVRLLSHRRPRVTKQLPQFCDVTFLTTSTDEYEQLCLKFDKLITDCDSSLFAANFLAPHWNQNETFNCMSEVTEKDEYCSADKQLYVRLTRKLQTNSDFVVTINSKKHSYWEYEEQVKSELVGLVIVRALIFIVSVINAVIALSVAVISFLHRNPLSSIRQWNCYSVFYVQSVDTNGVIFNTPNDHIPESYPTEKSQCKMPVI